MITSPLLPQSFLWPGRSLGLSGENSSTNAFAPSTLEEDFISVEQLLLVHRRRDHRLSAGLLRLDLRVLVVANVTPKLSLDYRH